MAIDQLQEICSLHTVSSSSETSGTWISIPGLAPGSAAGYPMRYVRIQYYDALLASSSGTLAFSVQASYDRGANWTTLSTSSNVTLSTTAQSGEFVLDFLPTSGTDTGVVLIRTLATFTGGTGDAVTYRADLVA